MNENLFNSLVESIKEAGSIRRGEKQASRTFRFTDTDIKELRNELSFSQAEFAAIIGVSTKTLQNWEQGRRKPQGPAKALLNIVKKHPEVIKGPIANR